MIYFYLLTIEKRRYADLNKNDGQATKHPPNKIISQQTLKTTFS